jgi:hypothetical protein
VNSDIESLRMIAAGFQRGHARLEAIRVQQIRNSHTPSAIRAFDLAFKAAMNRSVERETFPLNKYQRIFFGVDL